MTVYALIEFLHVLGSMGLFAAAALEGANLPRLRAADSLEKARSAISASRLAERIGGPSMGVVFVAGMYLSGTTWGLRTSWIAVGLGSLIVLGAVGGIVTGRRTRRLAQDLAARAELSADLLSRLRDPLLAASFRVRLALLCGIVFQMVAKPQWPLALTAAAASLAVGILASIPAWRASPAGDADLGRSARSAQIAPSSDLR